MITYIIRRLLLVFPTLLGVTAVVFFTMAYAPGGVGGPRLDKEGGLKGEEARLMREYIEKRYGLDAPPAVQYARWLNRISPLGRRVDPDSGKAVGGFGFKWPDLGTSLARRREVTALIADSLPITLLLNAVTIPIIYAVGIVSGIFAARYRGKLFDLGTSGSFLALWSVPTIWAGVMLIGLLANKQYVQLFPTAGLHDLLADSMPFLPRWGGHGFERGWLLDTLWHLILPVSCMTYGGFAFLSKLTRGSLLESLSADFVRTARAKGLPENVVLFRHAFRNSLLPMITVASGIFPALLGGAVIVETVFTLPGMGQLGVQAVRDNDRDLVLAVTLIGGLIGLLSEVLRDVCYAIADPRVSYE